MENVKEVDSFLKNDVQLSQASVPQGVLWQSLRNDIKALKALRAITENVKQLKRLGDKMEETKKSFKELRREVSYLLRTQITRSTILTSIPEEARPCR